MRWDPEGDRKDQLLVSDITDDEMASLLNGMLY